MTLPAFELLQPSTLEEALDMLAARPNAQPLAGGTCLLVDARARKIHPDVLVDLSRLAELRGIEQDGDASVLGAATTIAELLDSPRVEAHFSVLSAACRQFAAPLIRNRATLGGNLVHASPAADTALPLLVLDAVADLRSAEATRRVPISEFFVGPCCSDRRPGELLVSVRIPFSSAESPFSYHKIRLRKADAISVVSAAALRHPEEGGIRLALGAVAPTPIRALAAEKILREKGLTAEAVSEAARRAISEVQPIADIRGTAEYRRREVEVLVRRCLDDLRSSEEGCHGV
jgi:carbon-monoxide dehydrogenase medium subunit